jgi:hypothetical protein
VSADVLTGFAGVLSSLALVIGAVAGLVTALRRPPRRHHDDEDEDDDSQVEELRDAVERANRALERYREKPTKRRPRHIADFGLAGVT